jgi:hypothetical protein
MLLLISLLTMNSQRPLLTPLLLQLKPSLKLFKKLNPLQKLLIMLLLQLKRLKN